MKRTISSLLDAQKEIELKQRELTRVSSNISQVITDLCKFEDICPSCLGDAQVYDSSMINSGDPYQRSSDCRKACPRCGGSGKFNKEELKK